MSTIQRGSIESIINEIFKDVKKNTVCHDNYILSLTKLYLQTNLNDFSNAFIRQLMAHLTCDKYADDLLKFATAFVINIASPKEKNNKCTFKRNIIHNFICKNYEASDTELKYRVCLFVYLLLKSMTESLDHDLYDEILKTMLIRLEDDSALVRLHAVQALCKMQEPENENCKVIDAYINHLSHDPSPEVRIKIIDNIGKCQKTVDAMCQRAIKDDKEVRKKAYLYLSKVPATALKLKDRQDVLRDGLQKSEQIAEIVSETLLPAWLADHNNNILDFLKVLDVKSDIECAVIVINTLFKQTNLVLLKLPLPLKSKTIPIDKLTCENVLFWRCLIQHLQKSSHIGLLRVIVPGLTSLSGYIEDFENQASDNMQDNNEQNPYLFILCQLFEIVNLFDVRGVDCVKNLIENTLRNEKIYGVWLTIMITELYEKVVKDIPLRINFLNGILDRISIVSGTSEILVINNLLKSLGIICAIIQGTERYRASSDKDEVSLTWIRDNDKIKKKLIERIESVVLPGIFHPDTDVQLLAFYTLGLYFSVDQVFAKRHIFKFFEVFNSSFDENSDVTKNKWIMSLTMIFRFLLKYGLDGFASSFLYTEEDLFRDVKKSTKSKYTDPKNCFGFLLELIDHEVPDVRHVVVEGFCKLLEDGIISSVYLTIRLIIIYLAKNSENSEEKIYKILQLFFTQYSKKNKKSIDILNKSLCLVSKFIPDELEAGLLDRTQRFYLEFLKKKDSQNKEIKSTSRNIKNFEEKKTDKRTSVDADFMECSETKKKKPAVSITSSIQLKNKIFYFKK